MPEHPPQAKAGLEAQEPDLPAVGCEKVYKKQMSGVAKRTASSFLRKGDVLVVT